MAHTLDTSQQNSSLSASPSTFNYTCGAGATVLVLHIVVVGATDRAGGAPTYNGLTLTQVNSVQKYATSPETNVEMWYLLNPPTGSAYQVSIPNTGSRTMHAFTSSAKAASGKTTVYDTQNSTNGATANPSLAVTASAGGFVTCICGHGAASLGTGNKTQYGGVWGIDHGAYVSMRMYDLPAGGGSDTFTWTITADDWGYIVGAFKEATRTKTHTTDCYISLPPLTPMTYQGKYVVTSSTESTTTSTSLVDDPQASQTFSLSADQTVLVIYNAHNIYGATEPATGKQIAISVDSSDKANTWNSPNAPNNANGATTFWIGTLASGSHTIKGRFASNTAGSTATISERTLLIYILTGDGFQYIDSATESTTTSTSLVDDPQASIAFAPSEACKALLLYNVGNANGVTEANTGKIIAVNVSSTDYSQAEKSPGTAANYPDNVFTVHYAALTAQSYTAKGRFAGYSISTVTISRRQLGVLLLADSTLADYVSSDTQVSTTSNYPVDDGQATINRTTTESRELLVVAMGTKRTGTSSSNTGEAYGIKIDTNNRAKARNSPLWLDCANSAATVYAENLGAASHTIKGQFGNNTGTDSAYIDSRRVVALWFAGGANQVTKTHTTDTDIKATQTKTHTTDFLVYNRITKTHTTDSYSIIRTQKTHTTDSLIYARTTKTHTTNTYSVTRIQKNHTTDVLVYNRLTKTYTTDSLIYNRITRTHSTDSYIRLTQTSTHTTDSYIKSILTKSHTTDSFVSGANLKSHTTDALVKGIQSKTHTTDVYLVNRITKTHTTNSLLYIQVARTHATDCSVKAWQTKTHTTDTFILTGITRVHTTDTSIKAPQTKTHITDSLVFNRQTKQHTTNSLISNQITKAHTTDAYSIIRTQITHTTDCSVKAPQTKAHNTDTFIYTGIIKHHSTDSFIKATQLKSHTTHTFIQVGTFPPGHEPTDWRIRLPHKPKQKPEKEIKVEDKRPKVVEKEITIRMPAIIGSVAKEVRFFMSIIGAAQRTFRKFESISGQVRIGREFISTHAIAGRVMEERYRLSMHVQGRVLDIRTINNRLRELSLLSYILEDDDLLLFSLLLDGKINEKPNTARISPSPSAKSNSKSKIIP